MTGSLNNFHRNGVGRQSAMAGIAIALSFAAAGCMAPLERAAHKGNVERAAALLSRKPGPDGQTLARALGIATMEGHAEVVKVLLAEGVDVNRPSDADSIYGGSVTPLILAARHGRTDIARFLIDKGADFRGPRDRFGMDTLGVAVANGNADIVKLLLDRGADIHATTSGGYTALDFAEAQEYSGIVRLLKEALAREQAKAAPPTSGLAAQPARKAVTSDVDSPSGRAAEDPSAFALVVGVEKYSNDLPDARFAERDAEAVKSHLIALGFPPRNIKFLTGSRASKANFDAYLEDWLPRGVKEDSRVFFYFSGHGAPNPESGQAYLVPWDGNPGYLEKTAIPVKRLYAQLEKLKAKQVIVALDACFSGAGGRSVLAKGLRPLVTKVDMDVSGGGKLVLFAAASAKETTSTLEEQGHGIFTYYFLKGLTGEAKDASGAVTLRGLYDYLKPKVQDAASQQNREQTPVLEGSAAAESARFR